MNFDNRSRMQERIIGLLFERGWKRTDILVEPSYSVDGKLYQPDFVILYNNFPIAIIEVDNLVEKDTTSAQAQANYYLENIDLPLAYVIGPAQIIEIQPILDNPVRYKVFPNPDSILKKLNIESNNPLICPLPQAEKQAPKLYQTLAIRNVIQAILNNQKRVLFSMATGSGSTFVQAQIIGKLLRSHKYKQVLYLSDRLVLLEQTQKAFHAWGFTTKSIENETGRDLTKEIHFQTIQSLTRLSEKPDMNIYDLVFLADANLAIRINSFEEIFASATVIGHSSLKHFHRKILDFYGESVYTFTFEDTLSVEDVLPKEGYKRVQLSDIGEIVQGVPYKSEYFVENTAVREPFILLRGKDIDSTGKVNLDSAATINPNTDAHFIKDGQIKGRYQLQRGDILIQTIASDKFWNIAIIDKDPKVPTTYSNSLIKIRINPNSARPEDVYNYLRSTEGQQMLRRLATQRTSIARISPRDLVNFAIFLPSFETRTVEKNAKKESTIATIRENITSILDQAEKSINSEENPEAANDRLSSVSEQILSIVINLTPASIHDIVMNAFPTPIAIAYRRYHDSRFNVYEQLVRLRDLYEAIAFFVYNTVFSDWIYRLGNNYVIKDKKAVKAYSDFPMHNRIRFVDQILKLAKIRRKNELFLSELLEAEYSSLVFSLQSEFRNFFSHHGLGTEVVVKNSVNRFWPMVEELLIELKFLANYRMARITEVYSHKKSLIQRMELYRGPVPEIDEIPIEQNMIPLLPDKDHLILLDQDNQSLSLYPVYQLFHNEATRFERHIGFLKQVKDQKILGESVQGAFPVILDGCSELQALVKNATTKKEV